MAKSAINSEGSSEDEPISAAEHHAELQGSQAAGGGLEMSFNYTIHLFILKYTANHLDGLFYHDASAVLCRSSPEAAMELKRGPCNPWLFGSS